MTLGLELTANNNQVEIELKDTMTKKDLKANLKKLEKVLKTTYTGKDEDIDMMISLLQAAFVYDIDQAKEMVKEIVFMKKR